MHFSAKEYDLRWFVSLTVGDADGNVVPAHPRCRFLAVSDAWADGTEDRAEPCPLLHALVAVAWLRWGAAHRTGQLGSSPRAANSVLPGVGRRLAALRVTSEGMTRVDPHRRKTSACSWDHPRGWPAGGMAFPPGSRVHSPPVRRGSRRRRGGDRRSRLGRRRARAGTARLDLYRESYRPRSTILRSCLYARAFPQAADVTGPRWDRGGWVGDAPAAPCTGTGYGGGRAE